MAKVRLNALDYLIVASHYIANGKRKDALQMLEQAAAEEDFEDTLTTLDAANEEGFDDGEDDLDDTDLDLETQAEEELTASLANLQKSRRRRSISANADEGMEDDEAGELGEDTDGIDALDEEAEEGEPSEDLDLGDDTDLNEEVSTMRNSRRDRNLKALNRVSKK